MTNIIFSKIKAPLLKQLGFKTKKIAINFAKLSNVKAKTFNTEEQLLNALKSKLSNFQKLGLDFNSTLKKFDTSTKNIKINREVKLQKKVDFLKEKVDKFIEKKKQERIKPYEIQNL